VTDGHGEDPTLVVCIRCAQRFPARSRCPHCADLAISILEDDADAAVPWLFEVWQRPDDGAAIRVAHVGGFRTRADADSHAREFLHHYVAQRRASRRTRH
jgi:hypothetical protein